MNNSVVNNYVGCIVEVDENQDIWFSWHKPIGRGMIYPYEYEPTINAMIDIIFQMEQSPNHFIFQIIHKYSFEQKWILINRLFRSLEYNYFLKLVVRNNTELEKQVLEKLTQLFERLEQRAINCSIRLLKSTTLESLCKKVIQEKKIPLEPNSVEEWVFHL